MTFVHYFWYYYGCFGVSTSSSLSLLTTITDMTYPEFVTCVPIDDDGGWSRNSVVVADIELYYLQNWFLHSCYNHFIYFFSVEYKRLRGQLQFQAWIFFVLFLVTFLTYFYCQLIFNRILFITLFIFRWSCTRFVFFPYFWVCIKCHNIFTRWTECDGRHMNHWLSKYLDLKYLNDCRNRNEKTT